MPGSQPAAAPTLIVSRTSGDAQLLWLEGTASLCVCALEVSIVVIIEVTAQRRHLEFATCHSMQSECRRRVPARKDSHLLPPKPRALLEQFFRHLRPVLHCADTRSLVASLCWLHLVRLVGVTRRGPLVILRFNAVSQV